MITSERIAVKMSFATIAGQDLTPQRCAECYHTRRQVTFYAFIVAVLATLQVSVVTNPMTTEKNQGSTPRDLREPGPRIDYNRMGHQPQMSRHQTRFNEGLNRQYLPNYINHYQLMLGSIPGQDLSATLIELAKYPVKIPGNDGS